ncbi:type II toxin-antitoxin system death-on-curing family toxin [Pectobacterium wasabiae]|uniref:Death-on-curing protein n=1 Tax=Pectobacterium wasabiae TaxID=55208 RepID=A0AAW3EDR4_9GAMM|nr:type II toxin-antitoxin system death-on-curing family toxin [Pectobacterium wasabiae]AOR63334.1 death-on-curing protein [Pectobacterium wasabiae CFBP 3304]EJS96012.1 Death on curing protein [Pectobacterium wasabiae CFBP 3304]KFX04167.1 death-on-curing protein [Pectobacterium wasabiae]KGA27301.1 death-on-curing protein [Pectobacterium wasabiae]
MIFFLTVEQVIAIHDCQLEIYGGLAGFRDIGLVEGMVARVENLHTYQDENDLYVLAASLLLSIARGHGFNDANKRTSAASAMVFLDMNGASITPSEDFADFVVMAAQGLHDVHSVAEKLKKLAD